MGASSSGKGHDAQQASGTDAQDRGRMSDVPQLVIDVEAFQKAHLLRATGGSPDVVQYTLLRRKFLADPELTAR